MKKNCNVTNKTSNDGNPNDRIDKNQFYIIDDEAELEQLLNGIHPADAGKYVKTQRWYQGAPLSAINTLNIDKSYAETAAELAKRLDAIEAAIKSIERLLTSQIPHSREESVSSVES